MIDNTREGILNVLRAADANPSVKRVVHVNSLAAITIHDPDVTNGSEYKYDETTWNEHSADIATGERQGDRQYAYSKQIVRSPLTFQLALKSLGNKPLSNG